VKFQIRESVGSIAVCVPYLQGGKDLVESVGDTFTLDSEDKSKVYVADLDELGKETIRPVAGVFLSREAYGRVAGRGWDVQACHDISLANIGSMPVHRALTDKGRLLAIYALLLKEGILARESWYRSLVGSTEYGVLALYERFEAGRC